MMMIRQAALKASRTTFSKIPSSANKSFPVWSLSRNFSVATEAEEQSMEVFNQIDTNGDGVLSKEEFRTAMEMLHFEDLLKIKKSLSRNELSYIPKEGESDELFEFGAMMYRRVIVTSEVAISKIFPAGFGWQTAAAFAENAGMDSANWDFALTTGVGDFFGVFLGHSLWCAGKKALVDKSIDVTAQVQTGILLGSAAFCSGTVWQPTVNALQSAGVGFETSLVATGGACCLAFFGGLRLGRLAYSSTFKGVEEASYANLKADAALSVAVGGATGCFLGTDVSYGAANWLRPVVGIEEGTAALASSITAGTSTALGFGVVQMTENLVYPKNKCWVD